jgi:hypothetical protein
MEYPNKCSAVNVTLVCLNFILMLSLLVNQYRFAEVGPWGSSHTRWEMEARGEFTIEGWIEMSWMMVVVFQPGLAWKPWLWLPQTSGQAKAATHSLALAWLGPGRGFCMVKRIFIYRQFEDYKYHKHMHGTTV